MYPLLLLTGLMNDERVWRPILAGLEEERHSIVYRTDRRVGVAELAAEAIYNMPPGPFCVAGFSLGGYVAMEILRQAPERVQGVALLSTGARAETQSGREMRHRMIKAAEVGGDNFADASRSFLPRVLHPSHLNDPALVSLLDEMAKTVGREGFVRQQLTAMYRPDSLLTLEAANIPALILCGMEDQTTPVALSEEMATKLKQGTLLIIPECGHMVTLEQSEITVAALRQWLVLADSRG